MIVRSVHDGIQLITQPDHAHLARVIMERRRRRVFLRPAGIVLANRVCPNSRFDRIRNCLTL